MHPCVDGPVGVVCAFCDAQSRESAGYELCPTGERCVMNDACRRIKADFEEMPDLTLTPRQAARLCALDESVAAAALRRLEGRGILRQTRRGFLRSSTVYLVI